MRTVREIQREGGDCQMDEKLKKGMVRVEERLKEGNERGERKL